MNAAVFQTVSNTAETVVDLSAIAPFRPNDIYEPCLFSIEVSGNDAEVTVTAKGPFASSAEVDITDGTFPIGGAVKYINDAALSQLIFNRVGTTAYNINIIRKPVN